MKKISREHAKKIKDMDFVKEVTWCETNMMATIMMGESGATGMIEIVVDDYPDDTGLEEIRRIFKEEVGEYKTDLLSTRPSTDEKVIQVF